MIHSKAQFRQSSLNKENELAVLIKQICHNKKIKVYDTLDFFKKHKDPLSLFYRDDTHWNSMGHFKFYEHLLMEKIIPE